MSKKFLSILLTVAVLASALLPLTTGFVSADTIAAGTFPYAAAGETYAPIVRSGEDVRFYSDFVAKSTLDGLNSNNFNSTWKLYNQTALSYTTGGRVLATSSLVSYDAAESNVYGESGNALKIEYISAANSTITPANSSTAQYFHYVRQNVSFTVDGDYADSASVAFWVKSDYQAYIVVRLTVNSWNTNGFIVSERVLVPAGESIVEIPLGNFITANAEFESLNSSGDIKVNIADIYFKATESFSDTRNIYFDSLGFHYYSSESGKALHSDGATVKNELEGLNYSTDASGDKVTDSRNTTWRDDANGTLSVTSSATNVNAYNGSGSSICYTNANLVNYNATTYNQITNNDSYTTLVGTETVGENAVLCIWLKSDRALTVYLRGLDSSWSANRYRSSDYHINAGETVLKIPFSDIKTQDSASISCDFEFTWAKLNSLGIFFKSATDTAITGKNVTLYVDKIAMEKAESEVPDIPTDIVKHTSDFFEAALDNSKWVNKKTANATLSAAANAAHYHSGSADNNAVHIKYQNLDPTASNVNFYYDKKLEKSVSEPYIYDTDSVLSFWVWSDQPVDIRLTYMDYDNTSETAKQCGSKTVSVPAGESLVKVNMTDFAKDGFDFDYRYVNQLQFVVLSNEDSRSTAGNLYVDAIGFYDADTTNNIPEKPVIVKPEIPTTVVTHGVGFAEVLLEDEKWVNKKPDNVALTFKDTAHYHSGKTGVEANKEAIRVDYKNLDATNNNVNFYYNDGVRISKAEPYIFGETSVLSFWAYTEQSVDIKITYMDYSLTDSKSIQCPSITVTLPLGESLVQIPMKDLAPEGHEMQYRYCYQLQFSVYSNDDSYTTESAFWIDAIGFYDSALVINTEPVKMPENTYVWWNFDSDDTLDELGNEWTARFAGESGEGIVVDIEKNTDNVFGGKGNSLKVVYNRNKGEYGIPCIWHEARMSTYGDGLVFWIKSEEKTSLRLVALDASSRAVSVDGVEVTIGYNLVQVKWSDFKYTDTSITSTPWMASISQLQIRPNGGNNGTFYLDQVGFTNVTNDGSNAYYSLYPPTSYKNYYEGVSVNGDDFEGWPGDDDMRFCSEWYYQDAGWIALEKKDENTILRMDYDFTNGKRSELNNITAFKQVDPNGGISFWMKSSENRYYTLKVWLGDQTIMVIVKGSTKGRTYNIPFSAFWENNRPDKPFKVSSGNAVDVVRMAILTDNTCNPPSANTSEKCSLWLDDLKFVDSKSYKRASAVDETQNGVTLKAPLEAFSSGVTLKVTKVELTDEQKAECLAKMTGAEEFCELFKIEAIDTLGNSVTPAVAVELIFDVPEGVSAEDVLIYQRFLDGSLSARKASVGDDGKVHLSVYRLGEYVMGIAAEKAENSPDVSEPAGDTDQNTEERSAGWVIPVIIAVLVAGVVVAAVVIIIKRKGRKA